MVDRRPFFFLLLLFSYVLYLVIGAFVFSVLEQPYEDQLREQVEDLWNEFLQNHPCLSEELLDDFIRKALLVKSFGVSVLRNISGFEVKWDFVSSLFFTGTTLTTIGYGHPVPISLGGKIFCLFYSIIGIPFTLSVLSIVAQNLLFLLRDKLIHVLHLQCPFPWKKLELIHACVLISLLVFLFFFIPAIVFNVIEENWGYVDALYFCFISLSTVGLGDYVPGEQSGQRLPALYKILVVYTSHSSVSRCLSGITYSKSCSTTRKKLCHMSSAEESSSPMFEMESRSPLQRFGCTRSNLVQSGSGGDGTQANAENTPESQEKSRCQSCTSTFLKIVWGFLIILSVSSSWVGTTQIVKITYKNFYCPFFMTWFSTNWNIMFFPVYYSGHLATAQEKQSLLQKIRECSRIFGEDGLTLKLFLKRTAPFSILWTLTNYLYLLALKKLTATDVSALFCCNKAFMFLLSWIVLKDKFMGVRIVATIMAITGIVMMAYADGFHGDSIIGVALAVGSASASALYKVLFKMFLGTANFGEAAHFFSTLGFFNLIFISCTPIILYFTKVEHWSSFSALPWGYLCGVAGLWLAFNILVNVGVVLTYPILISIGTVLSVPGNAVIDLLKHEVIFSVVRLGATIIICIGFLLLLLPEEWDEITLRFINSLKEKKTEEHAEDVADAGVHLRSRSRANGTVSIPMS